MQLYNLVLPQHILQCLGIKVRILGYLVDDVCEIRKQLSLLLIRQYGRYSCIIKLYIVVVHLDEVDFGMCRDERGKCFFDNLRDCALRRMSVYVCKTREES